MAVVVVWLLPVHRAGVREERDEDGYDRFWPECTCGFAGPKFGLLGQADDHLRDHLGRHSPDRGRLYCWLWWWEHTLVRPDGLAEAPMPQTSGDDVKWAIGGGRWPNKGKILSWL